MSTANIAFEANLGSYWNSDLLSRYSSYGSSDSASFREALIADLRATGALAPASPEESSDQATTAAASETTASEETGQSTDSTSGSTYTARSNYYDFTTEEWQNAHPGYTETFSILPGLSAFLGDNPTYGSMFVNDGWFGLQQAINAYLSQNSASDSSSSGVSTTA